MKRIMKINSVLLLSIISVQLSFGQSFYSKPEYGADSSARKTCAENLSIMGQFVKIKLYDEAYSGWAYTFNNCPASKKNIYIYGEKIVKHKLNNAANDVEKDQWIDTLMLLYNRRIEHFEQEAYVRGKQGIDLIKNRPGAIAKAYEYLGQSIELGQARTKQAVFATYMQASYAMYKSNELAADQFINDYITCTDLLAQGRQDARTEKAINAIEKIFAESGAADCETLISIFTPKFEETPEDLALLKKIIDLLNEGDCQTSDLYAGTSEKLYELEPSAEAAYNLARLFYTRDDFEKAKTYYLQAIEKQTDNETLASYNTELAQVMLNKMSDKQSARQYALAAIAANPAAGEAYILIGNAYASSSSECGNTPFEKSAVYWAAVDKYKKAKLVDPSIADKATELINRYKAYFPGKEDAFFLNLTDGDSYKVGCWINESTTVRTK